jgi:putative ABC transport system ATP-binding protein
MSQSESQIRETQQTQTTGGPRATPGCWGGTATTFDGLLELDWSCGAESASSRIVEAVAAAKQSAVTAPADWEAPRRIRETVPFIDSGATHHTAPSPRAAKTIIRGVGLNKRYVMGADNYVDAVKDAVVEIKQGEMVAVMGPSGSGKSTLVHMLGCLDSADSGEVWLDGRRVDNLSRRDLAKLRRTEVGFIFQTFNLVPSFSALENVMLAAEYAGKGRREARGAAQAALAQVGLADRMDHRPTELSGGQQQRVAIARALVNGPKVIFGDEPTGNLDSASSAEIVEMMHEINEQTGTTFVLVTHDPGVAATCDRVLHMLDGRVTNGNGDKRPAPMPAAAS